MRRLKVLALLALLLAFGAAPLAAQTSNGEATGTVLDSSGSVLPGATVTLTNQGLSDFADAAIHDRGERNASRTLTFSVGSINEANAFNIINWSYPSGTTIGQAGAGAITSMTGTPRQIQLGARLVF
jgi:hypothetical protein